MDGWVHTPYINLGLETSGSVATYIDPGLLYHPTRSIKRGWNSWGEAWVALSSGSTATIPPDNCSMPGNGTTETYQCQTSHYLFLPTPITWALWLSYRCKVMDLMANPTHHFCTLPLPLSSPPFLSATLMTRHSIYDCPNLAITSMSTPLYIPSWPSTMVQVYCNKWGDAPGTKSTSSIIVQVGTRTWYSVSRSYLQHHLQISVSTIESLHYYHYNW